jgi:integrase
VSAYDVGAGFLTLLVSSGLRFCEAIGLRPGDFDFDACVVEVARSVVKVPREHHPQSKRFLVRDYTKNGQTRRLELDPDVIAVVRAHVGDYEIGAAEVIFPAELVAPPRMTKPRLTDAELKALGYCEPVRGRGLRARHAGRVRDRQGRCAGCRQWAREYGRDRMRQRRAAESGEPRRRWAKSRDADEPYLDEQTWNRIWTAAVTSSGIPFKPPAYQVRHTHASWLIDAGESAKAVSPCGT